MKTKPDTPDAAPESPVARACKAAAAITACPACKSRRVGPSAIVTRDGEPARADFRCAACGHPWTVTLD